MLRSDEYNTKTFQKRILQEKFYDFLINVAKL